MAFCKAYLNDKHRVMLPAGIHWAKFIQLAQKHRVLFPVHQIVQRSGLVLPPEVDAEIRKINKALTVKALKHTSHIIAISKILEEQHIPHLFIKGPVAAQQIYNDPFAKHSRDIDVVVDPSQIHPALKSLQKKGYQLIGGFDQFSPKQQQAFLSFQNQLVLVHTREKGQVEIHWRLFSNRYLFPLSFQETLVGAEQIRIGPKEVNGLSGKYLLFYLCTHGAKHHWSQLYLLTEVVRLLRSMAFNWKETLAKAMELGVERPLVQALLLAEICFQEETPPAVKEYAARDKTICKLVDLAYKAILGQIEVPVDHGARNYLKALAYRLWLRKDLRYKVGYWQPVSVNDFRLVKLPESLFFLYAWLRPFFWCWRYFIKSPGHA